MFCAGMIFLEVRLGKRGGMKKGQTYTGNVLRMDFPNHGIIETDTGSCVIKNALPGQEITFLVKKARKTGSPDGKVSAEGRLISVDKPAPNEIESPCPHFGKCGGCLMQNLSYDEQLLIKEEQVRRLLEIECFEGIIPSPKQKEYRNKMEFTFGDEYKGGPLTLGMHRRDSFYDIVPVDECRLVDEDFRVILKYSREYFAGLGFSYYHRIRHTGYLRHLLVRKAARTEEILVALVTTSGGTQGFEGQKDEAPGFQLTGWKNGLLELPLTGRVNGILHIINDSVADVVRADEINLLFGSDYITEEILGLKFKITPFSFFQTNSLGAEVLYEKVREYIGQVKALDKPGCKPVIYDLYCGTGTITQLLSRVAAKVIGVDINKEAIMAAIENVGLNGLHNCEFISGDVLKVLDEITEKPDFTVLDPPRDGINPKTLKKILAYNIPRLLYISCKVTSLKRDLIEFHSTGYRVSRVVAVDMFPATANVEVICLLEK